jgi:CRP/FNR family transcriptional regulator, cyclic AMP receptor protein
MNKLKNNTHTLKKSGVFSALDSSAQAYLTARFKARSFAPDETIFRQGEAGDCLYLIQSGKVKVCTVGKEGVELIFSFLSAGDLVGELAVFDGGPRSATAVAVENTAALCLERQEFLDFLRSFPEASIGLIILLCRRLRDTDQHLEAATFLDVSARLARTLIDIAPCTDRQEDLARLIGASRVMVNKVLNSFVSLGLIVTSRKKISVVNLRGLKRIAGYES